MTTPPRRFGWEYAKPIVVGDNVWLGAGVGVPARPVREIGEGDRAAVPQR
jgi:acetyltransferase-like isoleucine patch superfamily enzyme